MNSKMGDARRISFDLPMIGDAKSSEHSIKSTVSKNTRYEIVVDLFEPDSETFPEFNYKKLLYMEKKKHKKLQKTSCVNGISDDPFEDNDADVERIAKEFERKYGGASGYNSSKRIKPSNVDYCDKGVGYDDNDSFIDNTEAYDEIIPEEIETVNGGFYINSGSLEFKNISNFERPEDALRMPKPKKRIISSSSSSSSDISDDEDDTSMPNEGLDNGSKHKNGHPSKKQKIVATISVVEPIKIVKENKVNIVKEKIDVKKLKKDKKDDGLSGNESSSGKDKPVKTTTVKDMLRAKRDSCLLMKEGSVKVDSSSSNVGDKELNDVDPESTSSSFTSISSHERPKTPGTIDDISASTNNNIDISADVKQCDVKLPMNIPDELLKKINLLKEAGSSAKEIGKKTFFDVRLSELLLQIDNDSRLCGSSIRNQIYSYLECFLPCTKQTLLSRSRKLRFKQEENKLNKAYTSLKKEIDDLTLSVVQLYTDECAKVTQIRSKMTIDEKLKNLPKMPRRRFPWNEVMRNHFFEMYQIKSSFHNSAKSDVSLDTFIEIYLKEDVIKLWPEGWMKLSDLKKEINRRLLKDKKLKENEKPTDIVTISLENDSQNIPSAQSESSKSVLSSNNNTDSKLGEKTVQETYLKLDKSTDKSSSSKKSDNGSSSSSSTVVGSQSSFGSNLTITAVKPSTANPSSKSQINKVEITPVQTQNISANLPNNSSTSKTSSKEPTHAAILPPSAPKLPSSLSISITTSPSNSKETSNSTSRRTSDYSINSIMSSTNQSRSISPVNSNYLSPSSSQITDNIIHSKLPEMTIEPIKKSKSDTVNTQSTNKKENVNLNIRSVTKINNMVDNHDEVSGESSDDVEIVCVFPSSKKTSSATTSNDVKSIKPKEMKNKHDNYHHYNQKSSNLHIKTENSNSSSHGKQSSSSSSSKTENTAFMNNPNDNDLDVLQIMKDLKVLQEMQKIKN